MQVKVEIPDQFVEHLVPAGRDAARSLLEESVAGAYRDGRLTMEQVRQLLGFGTYIQVDTFLQQHQIYDHTAGDLDKDMATPDRLPREVQVIAGCPTSRAFREVGFQA